MHLQWIFIFWLTSCWIAPTEETMGSWELSSLLSALIHGDHETESETVIERSLSRRKRSTGAQEYTVDIEISFPDPSFANQIKHFLATNLTFPILLGSNDTEIESVSVTTACNQTGSSVQCSCERGYIWPDSICTSYSTCPGSDATSCDCIKGTSIPSQYCQPKPVSINLSIEFLEEFTADFKDPTSQKYVKFKTDLESQLTRSYKSLSGFRSANVTGFRPGSVIADYTVVTEPVSPSAMTSANSQLINNLRLANYRVDPSVKTIVTNESSMTVTPSSIFSKDAVSLTCTVNIDSYSSVAWYLNGTEAIQNTSYTTSSKSGAIESILRINRISLSNAGTYLCVVDDSLNSYQVQTTIAVQTLEMKILKTDVPCNNMEIPVIECCTQGLSMDFDMTCAVKDGIPGIARNHTPCKTYLVQADEAACASSSTANYYCTCSTMNGANETGNVKVIYQATYGATVSSKADIISEGKELTMQCNCNATSVQNIIWYFENVNIPSQYYTSNLMTCNSTLTIPSNVTTIAWNGHYKCSVETESHGTLSASKTITVARLINPSQISRSPVALSFLCNQSIEFRCCISNTMGYKGADLEIITKSGSHLPRKVMNITSSCFIATYTPVSTECADFRARCIITNRIDDTVSSDYMELTYLKVATCTTPYIGDIGSVTTISCSDDNPKLTGIKNFTCVKTGSSATWNLTYSSCVSVALDNIRNQLDALTSPVSNNSVPTVLEDLSNTVNTDRETVSRSPNDITLVVSLLHKVDISLDKVEEPVMENFLETVNVVVDNSTTWNQIPDRVQQSSDLLQSVENFSEKLSITGPVNIRNNSNIQLFGNVISLLTTDYIADFKFNQTNNLTGTILINRKSLRTFSTNTTIVSVAYATMKDILNTPADTNAIPKVINGLVMTTTVTENSNSFQIEMDFKKSNQTLNITTCVYWNFTIQNWDSTGCWAKNNTDSTMVTCVCDHLTSFSILMSYNKLSPKDDLILTYISYIGLGISILSLVICIIVEATVWKSVTKNKTSYMRHVCIMNIAVTLLMADIWFIIGSAMSEIKKVDACVAATFFTHVFYLCTFFWMLTMGLILFYRLMCVFHDLSKTIMMGISFFLGYGCPIIISVITVAVTQPSKKYTTDNACWLNVTESKAFLAFIIPALAVLLVNFITLLVVIIKVLRPSVGDKPRKEEKSSLNHIAKCILILTPLLGLTWGFGIGTLFSNTVAIHGVFAALNAFQGFFILLFGCLMDKKVRDALFSKFSISRWSSQQTKTSNLSAADPVFSKGVINLFAKKGVYNISSAQASSSSEMSNSYSLLT